MGFVIDDPSSAEAKELIRLVEADLAAARSFVARLVAIRDGLWAATLTAATAFAGVAVANSQPNLAFGGAAVVLLLMVPEVQNDIVFRRVRGATRAREGVIRSYAAAIREAGAAGHAARKSFRLAINRFTFGIEGALRSGSARAVITSTFKRARWYMHIAIAVLLIGLGVLLSSRDSPDSRVCIEGQSGQTVEMESLPELTSGSLVVIPCK